MNSKIFKTAQSIGLVAGFFIFTNCVVNISKTPSSTQVNNKPAKEQKLPTPGEVIPFFEHWNLILGDGSNVGNASELIQKNFFYTTTEKEPFLLVSCVNG